MLQLVVDQGNGNDVPAIAKKRRPNPPSISSDVFPSPDSDIKDVNFAIDPVDFQNNSAVSKDNTSASAATSDKTAFIGRKGDGNGSLPCADEERPQVRARSRTHPGGGSTGSTSSSGYSSSATTGGSMEPLSSPDADVPPCGGDGAKDPLSVVVSSQSSSSPPPPPSAFSDADIKTIIPLPPQRSQQPHGPPNVSLSPIIEHRLTSMSSISSGRNNSFDDSDMPPALLGEVLVVTHGGLLRQLISYFVDELGCKIPGGKNHALQTTPNTGLSKFTVSLSLEGERPMVTCLSIHDQDHLLDYDCYHGAAAASHREDVKPLSTTFEAL